MVTVVVELDQEIERQARAQGLLSSEQMNALLSAELERRRLDAGARLRTAMNDLSVSFRARYPDLSEEQALAMIERWLDLDEDNNQAEPG
jgi:F0F1-type ATP synthase membrane subunit b/b'